MLAGNGQLVELEFVVDTGFTGFLTLPSQVVAALQLPFKYNLPAYLADGSSTKTGVYDATILWNSVQRDIELLLMNGRPLLGTALLDGHDVNIQFVDGGLVTIEPL